MAEPVTPPDPSPRAPTRWRRWRFATVGVAVLVAAGGVAWWAQDRPAADATLAKLQAARADLAASRLPEAQERLRAVLAQWPLDAETHLLLARACRRADDLDGWREHLHAAEVLQWPAADIDRERVLAAAQTGDLRRAERELDPWGGTGDDWPLAAEALLKGYLVTYRLDDLLAGAQTWIDRRPDDWVPYYHRGEAYLYARLLARAADDFRRVLERNPGHPLARLRLAGALMVDGQFEDARKEFEAYLTGHPGHPEALAGLANCQFSLSQPAAARATLDRLFAVSPDDPAGCYLRAQLDLQTDPRSALEWLARAERRAPRETDVTNALIRVLTQLGRLDDAACYQHRLEDLRAEFLALDEARRAVRHDPDNPALRFDAGERCMRLGRVQEAMNWFNSALAINPGHAAARSALADLTERPAVQVRSGLDASGQPLPNKPHTSTKSAD
jgi:tetratricopeptide (TPR) repeat protein